eukprot:scaffold143298_cov15-Prasinocladus_malaysianus.AAC.1
MARNDTTDAAKRKAGGPRRPMCVCLFYEAAHSIHSAGFWLSPTAAADGNQTSSMSPSGRASKHCTRAPI